MKGENDKVGERTTVEASKLFGSDDPFYELPAAPLEELARYGRDSTR
jgi:hypothetical protein